ncbi:hypothetical protein ACGFK1_12300 [Mycobacterium sp. NPDC048908]
MSDTGEPCDVTEFRDANYNALWYAEQCLLRLQNHLAAAERDCQRPVA